MTRNGTRNGNRMRPEDRPVHEWYRFVLSFPPHLVRDCIKRFRVTQDDLVLDPFCGTGTTLVECKKLGVPSVGLEPNPMPFLATRAKVDWQVDPDRLLEHGRDVANRTEEKFQVQGIGGVQGLPLFPKAGPGANQLRTLSPELQKLLLKDSISPLPLHKALVLLETLEENHHQRFDQHERLALAKAIVETASNLHFGPEVGVRSPKTDAPVVESWLNLLSQMRADLRSLRPHQETPAHVHKADARDVRSLLSEGSVAAVITSPPYPNEKDYTRTTRLESVILGLITSKQQLRTLKKTLVRSNTRNVYKDDHDDAMVGEHAEIQSIAAAIERRRIELGKTSGWERMYSRVTTLYFGGMARHLSNLRTVLRPGAQLAYVVGDQASYLQVMIRTGHLLADIARSLGYEVVRIDLFRTRRATATKAELREEIVVLRWPGRR